MKQFKIPDFPLHGLLPKLETQAQSFLNDNPKCDGRGTLVAILDTGCCPAAPGLTTTTDGKHKYFDIIDCTGSGDVPCEKVVESDSSEIIGLTGRVLKFNPKWKSPTNKFHLGMKSAYDLFPKSLVDKMKKLNKEKFEIQHHSLVTKAQQDLSQHTSSSKEKEPTERDDVKNDLKARLETLSEMIKKYDDPGFVFDCVVFHDGTKWQAALDIDQSGDFTKSKLLTNYADEHQYGSFGQDSMLTFSVNIYDEGKTLSIVTCAGTHGTHVAGITAAYHPEEPKLNGVAPGAQIVSLKIGDHRLGSMETGTGLVRAAIEIVRLKCDLANMSYGESAGRSDFGRFIDLLRDEVINKSGCIFVSSAGNAGPALTTVGCPGGSIRGAIGVGAYVHKSMMSAEYAMLEDVVERPYTWSSRGPGCDGDIGVNIYAPGAAITSVPTYTIANSQLMNGTSMSSPNACGCIALLVSALKSEGVAVNPYRIRHAIINSSKDVDDPMKVGYLQVQNAWNYLSAIQHNANFDVFYDVSLSNYNNGRGVYLRNADECNTVQSVSVDVQPIFMNNKDSVMNDVKLKLEVKVALASTAAWVSTPEFLLLNNGGRSFGFKVDPTNLGPGFHFAQVLAYDTLNKEAGPLFQIPITICKPEQVMSQGIFKANAVEFEPGTIHRQFFDVPSNANFAQLIIKSKRRDTTSRLYVHLIQLQNQTRFEKFERKYAFGLSSTESSDDSEPCEFKKKFPVLPGVTLEVCLAQFWSSLDPSTVDIEIKFHGLLVCSSGSSSGAGSVALGGVGEGLILNSGNNGFTRMDLSATLRKENVEVSASLNILRKFVRPSDVLIQPLKGRDVLPDSKQIHGLVLTYNVKITESTSVTPRFPLVNDVLYDSCLDNFEMLIFDSNKKCVSFQDIYPKEVKLSEGAYKILVQITSASTDILNTLQGMMLCFDATLAKPITLKTFKTLADVISLKESNFKSTTLRRGERTTFWVGDIETLPKEAKSGDMIIGRLDLINDKKMDPIFPLSYLVPIEWKNPSTASITYSGFIKQDVEKPKEDSVKVAEAVRDLEIDWVKKVTLDEYKDILLAKLEKEHPKHLPVWQRKIEILVERFKKAFSAKKPSSEIETACKLVISACDKVEELVDVESLNKYFGQKHENNSEAEKEEKKQKELEKDVICLAYLSKAGCLSVLVDLKLGDSKALLENFDNTMTLAAAQFSDPTSTNGKYLYCWGWRQRSLKNFGVAIKAINKFIADEKLMNSEEVSTSKVGEQLVELKKELMTDLGWDLWTRYEDKWKLLKFPKEYAPF